MPYACFNRFEFKLFRKDAESVSHSGDCEDDVLALLEKKYVKRQLDKIKPDDIRAELNEYGAWDDDELADDERNRLRIVWLAGGNIKDELKV